MDLQSIANNNKPPKAPSIFQIIMMIIFVAPLIAHGFKWGWIYPVIALFTLGILGESLGVVGVVLWITLMGGSIYLCRKRYRTMKARNRLRNTLNLRTPSIMRDD